VFRIGDKFKDAVTNENYLLVQTICQSTHTCHSSEELNDWYGKTCITMVRVRDGKPLNVAQLVKDEWNISRDELYKILSANFVSRFIPIGQTKARLELK
jgi:hypothetical protein